MGLLRFHVFPGDREEHGPEDKLTNYLEAGLCASIVWTLIGSLHIKGGNADIQTNSQLLIPDVLPPLFRCSQCSYRLYRLSTLHLYLDCPHPRSKI